MKTAQMIEQNAERQSAQKPKRKMHPNSLANLVAPWTPETKPLSPGRPKDRAAEICRKAIEANEEYMYRNAVEMAKTPYGFQVVSDRAYGKPKETKELIHTHQDIPDADLNKRIAELERDLGLAAAIDEAGRTGIAQAGEVKTNGHAKDTDILSR